MNQDFSILVVDDEQLITTAYVRLFQNSGFRSQGVLSGQEAIERLRSDNFSVVLLDVRMPKMDGFETLQKILEEHSDQCVIFFTASTEVQDGVRAISAGAKWYVVKEIKFERLLETVISVYLKHLDGLTKQRENEQLIRRNAAIESTLRLGVGMAHQVKNRLLDIGIRIETLANADKSGANARRIEDIKESLALAQLAVSKLHDFARAQQFKVENSTPIGLRRVLENAVFLAKRRHSHQDLSRLQIVNTVSPDDSVLGDEYLMTQAFECVIDNAIDAIHGRNGTIEINCTHRGKFTEVVFSDSGPGFSPEMLNSALEPFLTSKQNSNIGFGMTFVQEVVKNVGGKLAFGNREKSGGAEIRIDLRTVVMRDGS